MMITRRNFLLAIPTKPDCERRLAFRMCQHAYQFAALQAQVKAKLEFHRVRRSVRKRFFGDFCETGDGFLQALQAECLQNCDVLGASCSYYFNFYCGPVGQYRIKESEVSLVLRHVSPMCLLPRIVSLLRD
jgi:hypothetical protein